MVPWSCHCQLVLRAGRQHPGHLTGRGNDGVTTEAADVAWVVKLQEALRTATNASAVNQPITPVLAERTRFIKVDTLDLVRIEVVRNIPDSPLPWISLYIKIN